MAKSGNFYINIIAKSVLILMSCHPHFRAKLRPFITASDLAILAWVVSHFFFHGPVASFASTAPTFRLTPNSYAGCISCDPPPLKYFSMYHLPFTLSLSYQYLLSCWLFLHLGFLTLSSTLSYVHIPLWSNRTVYLQNLLVSLLPPCFFFYIEL